MWSALLSLVILAGLVDPSIAQERATRSTSKPDDRLLRQNEDWSTFRKRPAERPTLKAVPLVAGGAGGPFLTVGGEVRSYLFGRMRATDAIYAIWGAPLRPAANTDARFTGVMPEAVLTWNAGRHVTLALEGSHFVPGPVLDESGPGQGLTHMGLRATYMF